LFYREPLSSFKKPMLKAFSLPSPVTDPPVYILESNLETQKLWYTTAGKRPQQPMRERIYFEELWLENFEKSSVPYTDLEVLRPPLKDSFGLNSATENVNTPPPSAVLQDPKRAKLRRGDKIHVSEFNGEIVFRGRAPHSHSVSKSFMDHHVSNMTIHIPYYRIFRSSTNTALRAEFLWLSPLEVRDLSPSECGKDILTSQRWRMS
jgi:hypothetical protein